MKLVRHPNDPEGSAARYQLAWHEQTGLWRLTVVGGSTAPRSCPQRWAWQTVCRLTRAALGLTQEQAARRSSVSLNTWARWERGEMMPTAFANVIALRALAAEAESAPK